MEYLATGQEVANTLQLQFQLAYFILHSKGASVTKIKDHLKQFHDVEVSHVAIYGWIEKYVNLMKTYVGKLVPNVGAIWHVDEQAVNVHGDWKRLWNLMDHDTRFLLANQLASRREIKDARKVFRKAKEIAKGKPDFMVTDGLRAYQDAFKKEFFTLRGKNKACEACWNS